MTSLSGVSEVPAELQPIGLREKICYGFGDVASCLVYGALTSYMLFFFTDVALLPAAAAGTLILVSRCMDGVSDVAMGLAIDRTNTKWGKCRPWLLWMALPWGVSVVMLFTAPDFSLNGKIVYAWITYNVMTTIVYTGINMPYGALASMITLNQQERGVLSVFRASFGCISVFFVSTFTTTFVALFGGGPAGWQKTFLMFAVASVILFLLCFTGTRERVHTPKREVDIKLSEGLGALFKNKYWMIMTCINIGAASMATLYGLNAYYASYILQDMGYNRTMMLCSTIALMIVPYFCIPFLKRYGKRNVALTGAAIALFGQLELIFFGESGLVALFVGLMVRGFGIATVTANKFGMITDSIEYGEYVSGLRTEGLVNSAASVGIKLGSALSSAVIGYVLAVYGYQGGIAAQSESALAGIRLLFFQAPLVVIVGIMILLYLYRLDKEYDHVVAELAKRKTGDSAA